MRRASERGLCDVSHEVLLWFVFSDASGCADKRAASRKGQRPTRSLGAGRPLTARSPCCIGLKTQRSMLIETNQEDGAMVMVVVVVVVVVVVAVIVVAVVTARRRSSSWRSCCC